MRKVWKVTGVFLVTGIFAAAVGIVKDIHTLQNGLIRMHVVAESDSGEDQRVKLLVRDAVINLLERPLADMENQQQAKAYLVQNLTQIEAVANAVLKKEGCSERAQAKLCRETFGLRHYDTFSLPAGVYESLRITIGSGNGKNWWCVTFPQLCIPATSSGFEAEAAGAGFSESLSRTLSREKAYELRFFLLDAVGKLENILFEE